MKAVVHERYGTPDVLELRDVPTPAATGDRVLVRVRAASVNRSDWEALTGRPAYVRLSGAGLRRPKQPIPGSDVAGTIEAVGPDVTRFQPGDDVLGDTIYAGAGAFAEYLAVTERAPLVRKPDGVSFGDAAAIPQAGALALQGLRRHGEVASGQRVLVVGAGGGGGSFALQLAKAAGAEVTGVDSTAKLELMRSLGADHVLDYTREDYTRLGERYDRILDFVAPRGVAANRRCLATGGVYQAVGGSVPRLLALATVGLAVSKTGAKRMGVMIGRPNRDDLTEVAALVASGSLTPAIDRTYPLAGVPTALGRVGAGEALGKLVVAVS